MVCASSLLAEAGRGLEVSEGMAVDASGALLSGAPPWSRPGARVRGHRCRRFRRDRGLERKGSSARFVLVIDLYVAAYE